MKPPSIQPRSPRLLNRANQTTGTGPGSRDPARGPQQFRCRRDAVIISKPFSSWNVARAIFRSPGKGPTDLENCLPQSSCPPLKPKNERITNREPTDEEDTTP